MFIADRRLSWMGVFHAYTFVRAADATPEERAEALTGREAVRELAWGIETSWLPEHPGLRHPALGLRRLCDDWGFDQLQRDSATLLAAVQVDLELGALLLLRKPLPIGGASPPPEVRAVSPPPPPSRREPPPRRPPPRKPPRENTPPPELVCAFVAVVIKCKHGRVSSAAGLLQVVGDVAANDEVTLDAKVQHGHGGDPTWLVDGQRHNGKLAAREPLGGSRWLLRAEPRVYKVESRLCKGESRSLEVHCYPKDELSIDLNTAKLFAKINEWLKKLRDQLNTFLGKDSGKPFTEAPELAIGIKAGWKEWKPDHRAYYDYAISVKMKFGGKLESKLSPIVALNIVNKIPKLGRYIERVTNYVLEAGVRFVFAYDVSGFLEYKRQNPDKPLYVGNAGPGLQFQGTVSIGVFGSAFDKKLVAAKLVATTALQAKGEVGINDTGVGIKGKFGFDALKGEAEFSFLDGLIKVKRSTTLWDPKFRWENSDYFYLYEW